LGVLTICIISGCVISAQKPNVIWLMAEDISLDLECYGMKGVETPVLNALADHGIKFNNCFTTNPICSPSRSAMMTGTHQLKINAQHHRSNQNVPLDKAFKPFTSLLRDAGYTCILGSDLVMSNGRKIDVNFKHAALGEWNGVTKFGLFDKMDKITYEDQPFFAQIQLKVTHRGDWWDEIREASISPVNPDSVEIPPYMEDNAVVRLDWAKYLDQIEYMDREIGEIINDLKAKGLYENTIIIFMGDNGRCNIFGKGYLHDIGLHVPLIVNWPGGIDGGIIREDIVTGVDITATILDFAGVEIPGFMTGKSFMRDDYQRDYSFATRDLWDEVMEKSRSLSTSQYTYIRNDFYWVPWDANQAYLEFYRPALHSMRKSKTLGTLTGPAAYFLAPQKPREELYDRLTDPHEINNLAENPDYTDLLSEFRELSYQEEALMMPVSEIFEPVSPISVEVYNYVKYKYPEEYLKMLNGVEIGFQKYSGLYRNRNKKSVQPE
jgi:N-sulfoglucosamine sulfohydrolase